MSDWHVVEKIIPPARGHSHPVIVFVVIDPEGRECGQSCDREPAFALMASAKRARASLAANPNVDRGSAWEKAEAHRRASVAHMAQEFTAVGDARHEVDAKIGTKKVTEIERYVPSAWGIASEVEAHDPKPVKTKPKRTKRLIQV